MSYDRRYTEDHSLKLTARVQRKNQNSGYKTDTRERNKGLGSAYRLTGNFASVWLRE